MSTAARHIVLTECQRELLAAVADGLQNKQIADALGKSPNTVRNQIHQLFGILEVKTRVELAVWYLRRVTSEPKPQSDEW